MDRFVFWMTTSVLIVLGFGKFQLYSRRANQTVLLVTTDGSVVVAPEQRDAFIAAVRQEIGG